MPQQTGQMTNSAIIQEKLTPESSSMQPPSPGNLHLPESLSELALGPAMEVPPCTQAPADTSHTQAGDQFYTPSDDDGGQERSPVIPRMDDSVRSYTNNWYVILYKIALFQLKSF